MLFTFLYILLSLMVKILTGVGFTKTKISEVSVHRYQSKCIFEILFKILLKTPSKILVSVESVPVEAVS